METKNQRKATEEEEEQGVTSEMLVDAVVKGIETVQGRMKEEFKWNEIIFGALVLVLIISIVTLALCKVLTDVSTAALLGSIIGYSLGRYKG